MQGRIVGGGTGSPFCLRIRLVPEIGVAKLVVRDPSQLPVKDGVLEWENVSGTPVLIELWGRRDSKLAADYYSKK